MKTAREKFYLRLTSFAAIAAIMTVLFSFQGHAAPVYATGSSLGPVTAKDVIYQIITDRFFDGDPSNNIPLGFNSNLFDGSGQDLAIYQGGDWQGIIDKIGYLKGMGITCIWISAPYENRDDAIIDYNPGGTSVWTSFHGYHVRNYYATNKHFGNMQTFQNLVDTCNANGIKVVVDFVTNHTSRRVNPTDNDNPEDGKLYEPDKLPGGGYAFDLYGNPYDYNLCIRRVG